MAMPQLSTTAMARQLRHFSLELRRNGGLDSFYTFLINPEELDHKEPARATVTQTLGSAYVDNYGLGLADMTINGTTGFHARPIPGGGMTDGYERFHTLRNNVYRRFFEGGSVSDEHWQLFLYMWEDKEYWEVFPLVFDLKRSKSRPLLYQYDLQFKGIRRLDDPDAAALQHAQTVDTVSKTFNDPQTQAQRASNGLDATMQTLTAVFAGRQMSYSNWLAAYPDQTNGVTPEEQLTESNFPGSSWVETAGTTIMACTQEIKTAVDDWLTGKTPYVNLFYADVQQRYQDNHLNYTDKLDAMTPKPADLLQSMQDTNRWIGLLLGYPTIFKPTVS